MQVRFDALNRFEVPNIYLCSPGCLHTDGSLSNVIGCIPGTSDEEIVFNFNATSELNFRVKKLHLDDPDENAYVYNIYSSIQNRRVLFVDDIGFFVINGVIDGYGSDGSYKDVRAESCESEIESKMLPYIEDGTYQFTPLLEKIISNIPLWTIALNGSSPAIDSTVAEKYRTFEDISEDTNCLSFMLENMQDAYECIFCFDCVNRTISVYDQNNYIKETSIHITKDDVINSIDITEGCDDLYTAINVFGDEDLNIAAVNPTGTNVIYNFDYYLDWMSSELRARVIEWEILIGSSEAEYYSTNSDRFTRLGDKYEYEAEISKLNIQLEMYRRCRENIVASSSTYVVDGYNKIIADAGGTEITIGEAISDTLADIDTLITAVGNSLSTYQGHLETAEADIAEYDETLAEIRSNCNLTSFFILQTEEGDDDSHLLDELQHYIYEGSYADEYITVTDDMTYPEKFTQMKTLYDRAKSQLEKISRPTQEFSIDVENFIFEKDFGMWSDQLETGCVINVELKDDDVAELFLSSIAINYDDKSLGLTFGNRLNKFDPKSLFENVLGNVSKSANSISFIKDTIYPIKKGQLNKFKEQLDTSRVLAKDSVLSADNQQVIIDDVGYTGRKYVNGVVDGKQVKIANNTIVFTDDSWDTCKTAIGEFSLDINGDGIPETLYGINAESIVGNMIIGGGLNIKDSNGNDLFTVLDNKIEMIFSNPDNNINKQLNTYEKYIRFVDGTIQMGYTGIGNDLLEYPAVSDFPESGDPDKIYKDTNTDKYYSWKDGYYIEIDPSNPIINRSAVSMELTNEKLGFSVDNHQDVAYFSSDKMSITHGEFTNRLDLGLYSFIPRHDGPHKGNLSFKKTKELEEGDD